MKRLRVYVDTSVLGGYFDPEFSPWPKTLMDDFRSGRYVMIISDVTAGANKLPVTQEALELLRAYQSHRILGQKFRNDMLHIAIATVAEVDILVSWNFRHIVRLDKIRLFNGVNLELGYKPLTIYSPREAATHETED